MSARHTLEGIKAGLIMALRSHSVCHYNRNP